MAGSSSCALLAVVLLAASGCDPLDLYPTPPQVLTPPTAGTHDEDPSLLRAQDGSFYLAWLSDRDGNDDVYVMRSLDAITWGTPVRVTQNANPDWYPHLIQTRDGVFHLVWFRANAAAPPRRWVMTASSADGLTWNPADEKMVTDGSADDWAPAVAQIASGDLLVYYSRGGHLYLSRSTDQGAHWDAPQALAALYDPAKIDVFPQVVERAPGDLVMVFARYASAGGSNYWDPSSDLWYAASADGAVWTDIAPITHDGFVDSVPNVYGDAAGAHYVIWTSTGPSAPASAKILDLPLSARAVYPSGVTDATLAHGMNGWSVAVAPTKRASLFLGVWVNADGGSNRLSWQVFGR